MKKQITLFVMMLCFLGVAKATELWTGEVATGDWVNNVTVDKSAFAGAAAGNILKVTFSDYATKNESEADITYWGFAFKKQDSSWNALTGFVDGNLTQGSVNACFRLSSDNVTELTTYGLAVQGHYITISKVELLTITGTETIYSDATGVSTGNYANSINKSYENKGKLSEALMNDFVAVTYAATGDGEVRVANPSGWEAYTSSSKKSVSNGNSGVFVYSVPNATILEAIQLTGAIVYGKNITITKIELLKGSDRYDAVPVTIGSDGIATFSTSSKRLDFSGTDIYPYYASAVAKGTVTLTKLTDQITYGWQGYILQGPQGSYEIPVTTSDGTCPPTNYLKPIGDYSGNVTASTDGTYHYIFAKDSEGHIGFYKLTDTDHTLAAHKAYLETSADVTPDGVGAPAIHLVFDEENGATALEQFEANDEVQKFIENGQLFIRKNGVTYDLMGRTVK